LRTSGDASQRKPKNNLQDDCTRQPERQREELTFSDFIGVQIGKELGSEQQRQTTFHETPDSAGRHTLHSLAEKSPATRTVSALDVEGEPGVLNKPGYQLLAHRRARRPNAGSNVTCVLQEAERAFRDHL